MRKIGILALLCIILLYACQDIKKDTQIASIKQYEKTVDSIRRVFYENKNDSIGKIINAIMFVEVRIKNNYVSDTINRELGKKINAYKMVRKKLKPIGKLYSQLEKGTLEEKASLSKLKEDIEKNAGNKAKYDEYIAFEKKQVNQLQLVLKQLVDEQNECLKTYHELHPEMYEFSMSLLPKKK